MDSEFRESSGGPDNCPYGITADSLPASVNINTRANDRQAQCDSCDVECPIKHYTKCRRRAVLKRENFHCPDGRF